MVKISHGLVNFCATFARIATNRVPKCIRLSGTRGRIPWRSQGPRPKRDVPVEVYRSFTCGIVRRHPCQRAQKGCIRLPTKSRECTAGLRTSLQAPFRGRGWNTLRCGLAEGVPQIRRMRRDDSTSDHRRRGCYDGMPSTKPHEGLKDRYVAARRTFMTLSSGLLQHQRGSYPED